MIKNKQDKYLFKIVSICSIGTILILIVWMLLFFQINFHKNTIIEVFSRNQLEDTINFTDQVERFFIHAIKEESLSYEEAQKKVIDEIFQKKINSDNQYVFFYEINDVLFEKDETTSKHYQQKTIEEVFDLWQYEGAQSLERFKKGILQKNQGIEQVIKNPHAGTEVITWSYFNIDNRHYIVGTAVLKSYLLTKLSISKHITSMYLLGGLWTLIIAILCIVFSLYIFFSAQNTKKLQMDIKNKNLQVEEFDNRLVAMQKVVQKTQIYDLPTGVYNKNFFDSMIMKANTEANFPLSMLSIRLVDQGEIQETTLKQVADCLKEQTHKDQFIARIAEDEFIMVIFDTNKNRVLKTMNTIEEEIKQKIDPNIHLMIDIAFKEAVS